MDKQTQKLLLAAIERIEGGCRTVRALLTGEVQPAAEQPPELAKRAKIAVAESLPEVNLGATPNFNDPVWPAASPINNIVDSERGKQLRATQVGGLIRTKLTNMNVLDVGCGEGHIARELSALAKTLTAYDIKPANTWGEFTKSHLLYTTNKDVTQERGPYDFALLYDTLDHLEGENPVEFMQWVRKLMKPNGTVFIRTHPWTSRHGGHLYEQKLNRAFVHLALTADELAVAGFKMMPNLKVTRPLATYTQIFKDAGLIELDHKGHVDTVDEYIVGSILDRIIKINWNGNIDRETAKKIMSTQFIDFRLTVH